MLKVSYTWRHTCLSSLGFVTKLSSVFITVNKILLFTVQCTFVSFDVNTEDTFRSPLVYLISRIILFDAMYLTKIVLFYLLHFFY